jgi:hypothetical protein
MCITYTAGETWVWLQGPEAGRVMIRRVRAEPAALCLAFALSVIVLRAPTQTPARESVQLHFCRAPQR